MGYVVITLVTLVSLFVVFKLSLFLFREVESPRYHVISKHKNMEVREYPPMIQVCVTESGNREVAIQKGFSRLAAYIFGKNSTRQHIKMTAPVIQVHKKQAWSIRFILPAHLMMNELPVPMDEGLEIKEYPSQRIAVIRFSGRIQETRLEHYLGALTQFLQSQGCELRSSMMYAFYNPPWTLPFLRRNEVWVMVDSDCRF